MKLLLTLLLAAFAFLAKAQNAPLMVTMNGIGDLKLNMKKADAEKVLGITLDLPHVSKKGDDYTLDTVLVKYKNSGVELFFERAYKDDKNFDIVIRELRSESAFLKTRSGIGIGDDKYKIISTYEGYMIYIIPEYEQDSQVKSKTKSSIWLHSDNGNVIIFYLDSNKVTGMSVTYYEGD
jgi:hypothetical protein